MQAAFLRVKLPYLDADNSRRRVIARYYRNEIKNPLIRLPELRAGEDSHVWHLFVIRHPSRERLQRMLDEQGIGTVIHYPIPPHRQEAYFEMLGRYSLPVSEAMHREVLSLPIGPSLSDAEIIKVVAALNSEDCVNE